MFGDRKPKGFELLILSDSLSSCLHFVLSRGHKCILNMLFWTIPSLSKPLILVVGIPGALEASFSSVSPATLLWGSLVLPSVGRTFVYLPPGSPKCLILNKRSRNTFLFQSPLLFNNVFYNQ